MSCLVENTSPSEVCCLDRHAFFFFPMFWVSVVFCNLFFCIFLEAEGKPPEGKVTVIFGRGKEMCGNQVKTQQFSSIAF